MGIKYGSVCSGIEAASVAWKDLGWEAQWYSEIEPFPSAVLAHRFPTVPNLGDMTLIQNTETFNATTIDLLVGGTPCQSFSVAGLRKGLDDPRGNLMLTFLGLADKKKPRWIVWENVPGVLSSNGGKDFGTFLGALGELGYGIAYRVLDAQYFGVAQRRRRVFVVGYLGDWRVAAAVLFEQHSLQGNSKKSREKRQATPADAEGGIGGSGFRMTAFGEYADDNSASTLKQRDYKDATDLVAHAFKIHGGSEVETGEQGGTPGKKAGKGYLGSDELAFTIGTTQDQQIAHPIAFNERQQAQTFTENCAKTLSATDYKGVQCVTQPIAFQQNTRDEVRYINGDGSIAGALSASSGMKQTNYVAQPVPFRKAKRAQSVNDHETWEQDEKTNTLNAFDTGDIRTTQAIVQPLAVDVYNQRIDGQTAATITEAVGGSNTSGPKIAQPIAVDCYNQTINERTTQTIGSSASDVNHYGAVLQPTIIDRAAFNQEQNAQYDIKITEGQTMSSLVAKGPHGVATQKPPTMAIRRLLPTECEILQGFPRNWTLIPYRNKSVEHCPDGPRYKACGNSMAVPVMAWIGKRIQLIENENN